MGKWEEVLWAYFHILFRCESVATVYNENM